MIEKWKIAIGEGSEILTIGDFNLDSSQWALPKHLQTTHVQKQSKMVQLLHDKILNGPTVKLNQDMTRIPKSEQPSYLDHVYSNVPSKIILVQTLQSFSDHSLSLITRSSRKFNHSTKYIRRRSFKNFDITEFENQILMHPLYLSSLMEEDPSIIAEQLQTVITKSLDLQAPIKTTQILNKLKNYISEETKILLALRDTAYEISKGSGSQEARREYCSLRNQVNASLDKDKFIYTKK